MPLARATYGSRRCDWAQTGGPDRRRRRYRRGSCARRTAAARIGETTGETTGETGETTAEIVAAEPLRRKRCAGLPTSACRPPQPIQVEVTNRAVTNRELPSADATYW